MVAWTITLPKGVAYKERQQSGPWNVRYLDIHVFARGGSSLRWAGLPARERCAAFPSSYGAIANRPDDRCAVCDTTKGQRDTFRGQP